MIDPLRSPEGVVGWRGLSLDDVQPGAGEVSVSDGLEKRELVDESSATDVDDDATRPDQGEPAGVEDMPRVTAVRDVQRHDVGLRQRLVETVETARPGKACPPLEIQNPVHGA